MHQIFRPWYRFFKYGLRYLGRGDRLPLSIADLERCWSSNAPARPAENREAKMPEHTTNHGLIVRTSAVAGCWSLRRSSAAT